MDLGILLVRPASQNKFQITLAQPELGRQPSFCIEPAEKPRRITTIDQWLNAFHVFIGIYTAKYPHDSPELIKCCSLIRDLAERGHNWLFYDENFHFMRQSRVSSLPWSAIHTELWLRSHSPPSKVPSNANRNSRSVPSSRRVFSVVGSIELAVVIFVPRGMNDNLSLPSPNQAMLRTPVRAVRLQYLLDGYDHSVAEFLKLGFTADF